MDNINNGKKKRKLLFKFATIFVIFITISLLSCGSLIYLTQMRTYKELKCNEIKNVSAYLATLITNDSERFLDYTKYYEDHYTEMRIPLDFKDPEVAFRVFYSAYIKQFPGKILYHDILPNDLPDDLKLLYFTYVHEYWLNIFEQAREDFDMPYTYFLRMDEETHYATYQIDGERIPDEERPGMIYLGDSYYEDPAERQLLWNTYLTGKDQNEYFEWDNDWGHTYSYYTPLILNGKCEGLVCAEVDVENVNSGILAATFKQFIILGPTLIVLSLILLAFIDRHFIYRIKYLSGKVNEISAEEKSKIASEIREKELGEDEIGTLSNVMADMLEGLEAHENEVEAAAKMKSDFLANMSHEIRTPMNAVIGMTDLILREPISDKVRDYAGQIKGSGNILLTIINDILDFSKIESGQLEIVTGEYKPVELINDVSNIIMNRIADKNVFFDVDYDPGIPARLYGDEKRIRQILINIANNAVKFTQKGYVRLHVGFECKNKENGILKVDVEDTGIGIKDKDIAKMFESFTQLDSKRNRNVEGNGLGLAISKQLLDLMDGTIHVDSEYGVGSTFSFTIPQKIADPEPSIVIKEPLKVAAVGYFSDEYHREALERDAKRLGIEFFCADRNCESVCKKAEKDYQGRVIFFFFDPAKASEIPGDLSDRFNRVIPVMLTDFAYSLNFDMKSLVLVTNPLYSANLAFVLNKDKKVTLKPEDKAELKGRKFTAPGVSILVVDDNQVNHVITEGLLEPLKMDIVKAMSGSEAVKLAGTKTFDMILMDHMMPGMDGVETMQTIRGKYPQYVDVPIIALTANVVGNARTELLSAGMNDFIPKPIGVNNLITTVKKWLPPEKIRYESDEEVTEATKNT